MISLLDVNVLVALFDPAHLHHEAAHRWFAGNRNLRWATCPLTENGLIRVLSNPSYRGARTTIDDAAARLHKFCNDPQHVFWQDSASVRDRALFRWNHVQGHRQIPDVYLLALSTANGGRLATFDSGVSMKSVEGATARNLEVLPV